MAEETTVAATWLYGKLSGDATLTGLVGTRIYENVAPKGTVYPLVVFQYQGGSDVRGVGPARIMARQLWVVKAIGQTKSFSDLKPIAERIDVLLQAASGAAGGGKVVACVREQAFKLEEAPDGVHYRHLGGIYVVYGQQ